MVPHPPRLRREARPAHNGDMTRVIMFTGKGGVGKTTCSAATALRLAGEGPTLALSTDATPSLSHIFELRNHEADVLPNLRVVEIGEKEIREMWDQRFGREVYEVFSAFVNIAYEPFVEFMTSILPGLGEEFMVDHIREKAAGGEFENIVWDTAPLGQTLSLLATPALLGEHLRLAPRIYSRLRVGRRSREPVLKILKRWEELSAENLRFLREEVAFTLVAIPEALSVEQLAGVFREMAKYGLEVGRIVINNVVRDEGSAFTRARAAEQRGYLEHIRATCGDRPVIEVPMFAGEVKGAARLREVADCLFA
jgi:arsenite-transporting ATPase